MYFWEFYNGHKYQKFSKLKQYLQNTIYTILVQCHISIPPKNVRKP